VAIRKRLARFAEKFQAVQKVTHGFSNGARGALLMFGVQLCSVYGPGLILNIVRKSVRPRHTE
jgi:hypothetical protein